MQNVPGPSRAPLPIQPRRREAPLPPAPAFHEPPSQASSLRSSYNNTQSQLRPGSSKQVSFHTPPQQQESSPVTHQPPQSTQNVQNYNLPPLPPGFDLAQLSQLGGAGLEMAIRMGIEMGMNLSQQQTPAPPASQVLSPPLPSAAPSPTSQFAASPERTRRGGRDAIVNNILHDNFLSIRAPPSTVASPVPLPSYPLSRRPSHGDGGEAGFPDVSSPDEMAKKDPLASQVWKAYAKDRGAMPNGARMENLTWRLMHLTLKKTEEREAKEAAAAAAAAAAVTVKQEETIPEPAPGPPPPVPERGRSKGKSRVVGFQGASASPE